MCKYCEDGNKTGIAGAYFELMLTNSTKSNMRYCKPKCFILKCQKDEKAGLMIESYEGCSYIDINYCPMCGRKLGAENE